MLNMKKFLDQLNRLNQFWYCKQQKIFQAEKTCQIKGTNSKKQHKVKKKSQHYFGKCRYTSKKKNKQKKIHKQKKAEFLKTELKLNNSLLFHLKIPLY